MTESITFVAPVLTILAALGSGLNAGLFFAFSAFVMKALAGLPPAGGIAAMQAINVAVLNRVFFAVFFGTAALSLALLAAAALTWPGPAHPGSRQAACSISPEALA
ncbi:MAG TPA: hypothetical protein VE631_07765 [Alphaproteobacteria bacterium]|jgi:uncharacterized membrane protein|nr:hypothetical protein [Alphaproteobacteria bacterium]